LRNAGAKVQKFWQSETKRDEKIELFLKWGKESDFLTRTLVKPQISPTARSSSPHWRDNTERTPTNNISQRRMRESQNKIVTLHPQLQHNNIQNDEQRRFLGFRQEHHSRGFYARGSA
jgi:hypothetical protein